MKLYKEIIIDPNKPEEKKLIDSYREDGVCPFCKGKVGGMFVMFDGVWSGIQYGACRSCGASYLEEGNAKGEHRKAFRIAIEIKEE